jgi:hypothetical protein
MFYVSHLSGLGKMSRSKPLTTFPRLDIVEKTLQSPAQYRRVCGRIRASDNCSLLVAGYLDYSNALSCGNVRDPQVTGSQGCLRGAARVGKIFVVPTGIETAKRLLQTQWQQYHQIVAKMHRRESPDHRCLDPPVSGLCVSPRLLMSHSRKPSNGDSLDTDDKKHTKWFQNSHGLRF